MDPMTIALLAGALYGGVQGEREASNTKRANADRRKVEAVKAKWYGYNKEAPQTFQDPDMFSAIIGGGLQGAQTGASLGTAFGLNRLPASTPKVAGSSEVPFLASEGISLPANKYLGTDAMSSMPNALPQLQPASGYAGGGSQLYSPGVEGFSDFQMPEQTAMGTSIGDIMRSAATAKKRAPTGPKALKKASAWQGLAPASNANFVNSLIPNYTGR